jgi:hypothetical protein
MLRRSRVSGIPDIGRIGAALARPGMDPRQWVSFAYANADSQVSTDGHFVEVTLAPSGQGLTCHVPAEYAGNGFGIHCIVHADDELVVIIPDGDPNHGGDVIARQYSSADSPSSEAIANPDDFVLVVEKDKNLRLITHGGGKSYLNSDTKVVLASPAVHLGKEDPNDAIILGTTFRQAQGQMDSVLMAQLTVLGTLASALAGQFTLAVILNAIPIVGGLLALPFFQAGITSGIIPQTPAYVSMDTAITTFETNSYLSGDSKTS